MSKTDFAKIDAMPDEKIDFSDIPPLTDAQLASMKPLHDVFPSELCAQDRATVQLDADIFECAPRTIKRKSTAFCADTFNIRRNGLFILRGVNAGIGRN